ncbi:3-oxoacyl-ACP synthase [Mucilaginibacter achroorhodeus]|uniref:3-oxoacyl-ACP synthase n=1 Tax=Mucilaginibacter achroorhodeus TaxID=2599294 RepID=A0A563TX01_9SPHI|nr:3-oxoacyl-ACP synthase [Mucilaginibacter achroorhodeus]TWR23888.1 3-oxoacyl-ACP synthase [Mucilaginibacter achroorhodeus]
MSVLKEQLHQACVAYVQQRIQAATEAIEQAQQAQTDDTKSSAGDKYETGREMAQQESNRNAAQLAEANKLMVALNRISTNGNLLTAEAGSVVATDNGSFYLAVSAGILSVDGKSYFAVSAASPIGLHIKGKTAGEKFSLNGKDYNILSVE